jgi:hypothetical protein
MGVEIENKSSRQMILFIAEWDFGKGLNSVLTESEG